MSKKKPNRRRVNLSIDPDTHRALESIARRGRFPTVTALVHAWVGLMRQTADEEPDHDADPAEEVRNMFRVFRDHESPRYGCRCRRVPKKSAHES